MSLVISFQSKLTTRVLAFARIVAATVSAMARTPVTSGPLTRYCSGQSTGGPSASGSTRAISVPKSSASTFSSRARTASRTS